MAVAEEMRVRAMTQPAQAQQPLWRRYEEPDGRGLIDAVCEEVRLLAEHGTQDPGQTIALAVAGAEAAEGLTAALEDPWALYTPQQVAVAASALFTQITAAGTALEKLDRLLDVMAERGDITEPDHDGVGEAERLCTAQSTLGAAGQEAAGAIDVGACEEAVDILTSTPCTAMMPTNTHETLTQLAGLLGDSATLIPGCRLPHGTDSAHQDFQDGCGCRIELTSRDNAAWTLQRSDAAWYLMPLANPQDGGSDLSGTELSMTETCPHPRHFALLLHRALDTAA
ncbi:hypothetical protein SUDANB54_06951 [Streptomyces sp. enrichment culture]